MQRLAWLAVSLAPVLAFPLACGSSSSNGASSGGDGGASHGRSSTSGSLAASSARHASTSSSRGSGSGAGLSSGAGSTTRGASTGGSSWSSKGDAGIVLPSGRSFPDTTATIAILADQLPSGMPAAQQRFAASHYVGTQKQVLPDTQALRALNKNFLVLHYHLAMWQSAPSVEFIINGTTWGNDYPTVTQNETWFWHNSSNERVTSSADQKLLMNVSVSGFQQYWAQSLATQVADGQYDAIFFDSASPALLQGECGGGGANQDPRLAGTAAHDTTFAELGNTTWIDAWQTWIAALSSTLAAQGIPLIPNTGPFTTGWDTTDYGLTPGIFSEGFAGTGFAESDWQASTDELLKLAAAGKVMILQNYLSDRSDVATRLYYLGNYLLVKGASTYLDYFANGPLEWYPEWKVDSGRADHRVDHERGRPPPRRGVPPRLREGDRPGESVLVLGHGDDHRQPGRPERRRGGGRGGRRAGDLHDAGGDVRDPGGDERSDRDALRARCRVASSAACCP